MEQTKVQITFLPYSYAWARLPRAIRHMMEQEVTQEVRRAINRFLYEG